MPGPHRGHSVADMSWHDLAASKYARLTTYKRDGTPVSTAVWVAADGERIVVWTGSRTGKVKRLRSDSKVLLQISDNRGRPKEDCVYRGRAEILDAEGTERVRALVARKYGAIGWLGIRGHRLLKGADATVGLAITQQG
ncbi:PPOX class F420-dependent oxidoreductase [Nocardia arthritidis]|uniref:PPOX class F420-dependent oxidoreductase n=2 Tax=Nocardia arthritidis TaxID=228602 RepID=A0A6G9YIU0_9NOCA|nr:PPOX class F420-dependent oxidoreductase [Nocardia arthritidis]